MGAPKIKVYQLPRGYSEDGDNDVQQVTNDELIPLRDKPITPEDFFEMTGVKWKAGEILSPINFSAGEYTANLTPDETQFQESEFGHTDILIAASGISFVPVVKDSGASVINPTGYVTTPSGIQFLSAPYPSGAIIEYWRAGASPTTHYVTAFDDVYNGDNWEFRETVYDSVGDSVDRDDFTVIYPSGLVVFNASTANPTADYTYETINTKYFVGGRENWIENHLYLSPDVFKGTFDYPGDDSEDDLGNPIAQGAIPQFVESSEYQIDFRKGLVTFSSEFDSSVDPVHASYACLVGVRNATAQELAQISADPSGGYTYKVVSDNKRPETVGVEWIGRNDSYTPRNFYVDGALKPQLLTVQPYDTLTIKTS